MSCPDGAERAKPDVTDEVLSVMSERTFWRVWAELMAQLGRDPGPEPEGLSTDVGTARRWLRG
jgi:hypothetical protein